MNEQYPPKPGMYYRILYSSVDKLKNLCAEAGIAFEDVFEIRTDPLAAAVRAQYKEGVSDEVCYRIHLRITRRFT